VQKKRFFIYFLREIRTFEAKFKKHTLQRMVSSSHIYHSGVITHISDESIEVRIEAKSACSSCHAKSACHVSESEDKVVTVSHPSNSTLFSIGQNVNVFLAQKKGFEALFFGYLLPFLLMFGTLLIASQYVSEIYAGLYAIVILIPYYIVLYYSNKFMRKRFSFHIESI
jgi:sigma-E factor negative regulatory protein RseC